MEGVRIRLTIKPPHSDLQKREGGEMGDELRGGEKMRAKEHNAPLSCSEDVGWGLGWRSV